MTRTRHNSILQTCRYALAGQAASLLWVLLVGGCASALGGILNPIALRWIVDRGIRSHNLRMFVAVSLLSFASFALWRLLVLYNRRSLLKLKQRILPMHVARLWGQYCVSDYAIARERSASYHMSFIYDEVLTSVLPFVEKLVVLCNAVIGVAACLILMMSLSPGASIYICLAIPPLNLLSLYFTKRIRETAAEEQAVQATARDHLAKTIAALPTVRLFGIHRQVGRRLTHTLDELVDALYKRDYAVTLFQSLSGMASSAAEIAIILVSGYEVVRGRFTYGMFFAFMNSFWMALGSSRAALEALPEMLRLSVNLEILRTKYPPHEYVPPRRGHSLALQSAGFRIKGASILSKVSFTIDPASRTVIRGPNGSGKSTLGLLIGGLLEPSEGWVTLPTHGRVVVITDPMQLPPGTLAEILPEDGDSLAREKYAARLGLLPLLHCSPDDMSAGQRKKAQILFGLSFPASVYIFDEPLAHLDPASKSAVMELLLEATADSALIVIMHGDDALDRHFDTLYTLTAGRLALADQFQFEHETAHVGS